MLKLNSLSKGYGNHGALRDLTMGRPHQRWRQHQRATGLQCNAFGHVWAFAKALIEKHREENGPRSSAAHLSLWIQFSGESP